MVEEPQVSLPNLRPFRLFPEREPSPQDARYADFLLEAHKLLSCRSDYVGLSAYGSQFTGVTTVQSDYDILLIAGDSNVTTQESVEKKLERIAREKFGLKSGIPHFVDRDYFVHNFDQPDEDNYEYSHAAWRLAYPLIGDTRELCRLRRLLKHRHRARKRVAPRHAEDSIYRALRDILFYELNYSVERKGNGSLKVKPIKILGTREKLLSRGYSVQELQKVAERRAEFWLKRLRRLFGD